ncbi:tyrosine-type recombinase/integrase [Rhodococcus sp. (in: high G+C Gram-positive bacteria)]|uniref:tyrosine-type recombinase/integrase n=1 Tax=Rhodococcus sp. TaxID=1831 RepID=UPI001A2E29C7|nr:tyrosine-type recombinase/integrase [Rhodococcus sp. (in: high G+C Gram-positive bacteria)]MBJ7479628.1 site-specific integrase [Rhodococcus sp. (in: high G+C Gram-positive bacteria)]
MNEPQSESKTSTKRNRRSGIEDRWYRRDGNKSTKYGTKSRWQARFVDYEGHEHMKVFVEREDAQSFLDQNAADLVTGKFVGKAASTRTVGSVSGEWMKHREHLKPKTVAGYHSLLDGLVLPTWKNVALADVDYAGVRSWVTAMQQGTHAVAAHDGQGRAMVARKLSASRVIQAHQVLKQVLDEAVKMRLLPVNPAVGVSLPRKQETERRYLDHTQVDALATASGDLAVMVYVLAYCGLRFGEVVALQVRDVGLGNARLTVRRSVTYVTGTGFVEGTTKGHESREVPVPAFLVELLREHVKGRKAAALVFPPVPAERRDRSKPRSQWMTPGEFRWAFDPAAVTAGVDGLVPHELRHTAASLAIQSGANIKVVQKMLGHKTATLTLDRYGHLFDDELDGLATRLDTGRTAALKPKTEPVDISLLVGALNLTAEQITKLGDLIAG